MDENQTEGVSQTPDVSGQESVTPAEDTSAQEAPSEGTEETQETASESQGETTEGLSEEERQHLSERTQGRIRQLIKERNEERDAREETEQRLERLEQQAGVPARGGRAQERSTQGRDPTLQRAKKRLKDAGFITKDDFQQLQDSLVLQREYDKLQAKYDGSDGRPKFDPVEVEDYMKRSGNYNPEDAYTALYHEELVNAAKREAVKSSQGTYSESPDASPSPESRAKKGALSREDIANMSPKEYEEHREEILRLMGEQKI